MAEETLDTSLTAAVTKAVEDYREEVPDKDGGTDDGDKTAQEDKTTPGEEVKEDEDTKNGRLLIQALKDPAQSAAVIDFLATQAGYTKANIQTKADVKEAKEEIESILERNLGDEFKFLVPKLAPAIKESLNSLLEGHDSDIRLRLDQQELKEIQKETAETHNSIAQEWFGSNNMPDNVIKAMSAAMDEFPPTDPKMSPERYYRRIFNMVAGELNLTKKGVSSNRSDRIEKNRKDEVARNLTSQQRGVTPNVSGGNPRKLSLNDAVNLAMEEINQASRK